MPKEQNTIKITKEWYHMATTLGPTTLSPVKPFFFFEEIILFLILYALAYQAIRTEEMKEQQQKSRIWCLK